MPRWARWCTTGLSRKTIVAAMSSGGKMTRTRQMTNSATAATPTMPSRAHACAPTRRSLSSMAPQRLPTEIGEDAADLVGHQLRCLGAGALVAVHVGQHDQLRHRVAAREASAA